MSGRTVDVDGLTPQELAAMTGLTELSAASRLRRYRLGEIGREQLIESREDGIARTKRGGMDGLLARGTAEFARLGCRPRDYNLSVIKGPTKLERRYFASSDNGRVAEPQGGRSRDERRKLIRMAIERANLPYSTARWRVDKYLEGNLSYEDVLAVVKNNGRRSRTCA